MLLIITLLIIGLNLYVKKKEKENKAENCSNFISSKKGIDQCYFCGKKSKGSYFVSPKDPSKHEFECDSCNKKHWGE
jgi:hypothetical protein